MKAKCDGAFFRTVESESKPELESDGADRFVGVRVAPAKICLLRSEVTEYALSTDDNFGRMVSNAHPMPKTLKYGIQRDQRHLCHFQTALRVTISSGK